MTAISCLFDREAHTDHRDLLPVRSRSAPRSAACSIARRTQITTICCLFDREAHPELLPVQSRGAYRSPRLFNRDQTNFIIQVLGN